MELSIDGQTYVIDVHPNIHQSRHAPRLAIVAYQPNELAKEILRVCIESIRHYTPEPHELWVVDNNSPPENKDWLLQCPDINVVFNRTEPMSPESLTLRGRLRTCSRIVRGAVATNKLSRDTLIRVVNCLKGECQQASGSYANAIGLEITVRLIDPDSRYLMTLHMDTMPCHTGWLSFLQSKMDDEVRAVGVRMDKKPHRTPEGALHVLGYLVDFQLFRQLDLDFMPRLPRYDVGDRVTLNFREAGYEVWACPNSLWDPQLINKIPISSPLRDLPVDRSFDDAGNAIFLHLGRGVEGALRNSAGEHQISPSEWVEFAEKHLLPQ